MLLGGPPAPVAAAVDWTIAGRDGAVLVRVYTPVHAAGAMLPGMVYLHGGGLVAGAVATHEPVARALAHAAACRVVSVEYRLAPEHSFPAALDDALAAVRQVAAHAADFGIDSAKLGICGDSAGGTLAAATCQAIARDGGEPKLALQLLICPILDFSRQTASRCELASGYLVDQDLVDYDLSLYAMDGVDRADPRVSPAQAGDLSGLPRTIIHTAEFDPFRDEGRHYFDRLETTGAALSYTCHAGMIHLFYGLGAVIPYASGAWERIGAEVRTVFASER
ncbi:MAG: alpha/beta hydrolase [Steroidobacteraceae bacterium]